MDDMKKLAFVVVVAACFCWALGEAGVWSRAQDRTALAAGDWLVGAEPVEVGNSFEGIMLMPKTQVPGDKLSLSFTFRHALWPGMEGSNLYWFVPGFGIGFFQVLSLTISGYANNGRPGQFCFRTNVIGMGQVDNWFDVPVDGVEYAEIDFVITLAGELTSSVSSSIIGSKTSPTHSKEIQFNDQWVTLDPSVIKVYVNDVELVYDPTIQLPLNHVIGLSSDGIDADDWSEYLVGVKYAMSIDDIKFSGNPIDTSEFAQTTWGGTAASVDKLWVEGYGGNSIGFWASEAFYNGAYVYNTYTGGTINAPFSYDFSDLAFKWMDDTNLPSTLEVYCTGLRKIIGDTVYPLLPWKGTIGELAALGRYTQKHGCYYWSAQPPDMQASVALYLSLTSAEAHGIEIRGPRPEYKVEGRVSRCRAPPRW